MEFSDGFRIAGIIARHLAGNATEQENAALQAWIDESPDNRKTFENITNRAQNVCHDQMSGSISPMETMRKIDAKYRVHLRRRRLRVAIPAAAAALLAGVVLLLRGGPDGMPADTGIYAQEQPVILILDDGRQITMGDTDAKLAIGDGLEVIMDDEGIRYAMDGGSRNVPQYNTVKVAGANVCRLQLPDGSIAVLNAGSELKYPVPFPAGGRQVWLSGEAWFEVVHDERATPFTVRFGGGSLKVLGTSFNVSAYPGRSVHRATLIEGSVECSIDGSRTVLTPGLQAVYDNVAGTLTATEADTRAATAWLRGQFMFDNEPLADIMDALARWYGVEVVFTDTVMPQRVFSLEVNRYDSMNRILELLEETGRLTWSQSGRRITISAI